MDEDEELERGMLSISPSKQHVQSCEETFGVFSFYSLKIQNHLQFSYWWCILLSIYEMVLSVFNSCFWIIAIICQTKTEFWKRKRFWTRNIRRTQLGPWILIPHEAWLYRSVSCRPCSGPVCVLVFYLSSLWLWIDPSHGEGTYQCVFLLLLFLYIISHIHVKLLCSLTPDCMSLK